MNLTKKRKFKIFLVVFVLLSIIVYLVVNVSNMLVKKGTTEFHMKMSNAVYEALGEIVYDNSDKNSDFSNLVSLKYDNEGNVTFISADTLKINYLSYKLATRSNEIYEKMAGGVVSVPLGVFSGFTMLSGLGDSVELKLITIVSVKCEFVSDFSEAGINTTRQTLTIVIIPEFAIITNVGRIQKTDSFSIPVYDNYIQGKVPTTFLEAKVVGKSG